MSYQQCGIARPDLSPDTREEPQGCNPYQISTHRSKNSQRYAHLKSIGISANNAVELQYQTPTSAKCKR